jgi:hypothetical protein
LALTQPRRQPANRTGTPGARPGKTTLSAEMTGFGSGQADVEVPLQGSVTKDIELIPLGVPSGQSAVFNTGVADDLTVLPAGAADPHWRVFEAPAPSSGPPLW